jgi:hypothetical protein
MSGRRPVRLLGALLALGLVLALAGSVRGAGDDVSAWWAQTACAGGGPDQVTLPEEGDPLSVGVQFHGMWSDYTDEERIAVLDRLAEAGADSVRIDVAWSMLQPDGPGLYSEWGVAFVDRVLDMAHARGLAPLVMLWMTPDWANAGAGERVLPDDVSDFGRLAQWAAARWGDRVAAWEVWNEPNHDHYLRGADPAAYARLLQAGYCGFKTGAPNTPVVFAGTSYVDTDWVSRAYDAGAGGYFDVMGVHPYMATGDAPPETPDDGTGGTLAALSRLHAVMAAHGDAEMPVWVTEIGWSSYENTADTPSWARGVPASVQADYLLRALDTLRADHPYVQRVYWYRERDTDSGDPRGDNFGLLTRNLRPKPVYRALADYLGG